MNNKLLMITITILILGLAIGFSLSRWVFEPTTEYGTIEEAIVKIKADSVVIYAYRDSLKKARLSYQRESKYNQNQKNKADEKLKKLADNPLTDFQRDSLESAIFEE